MMPPETRESTTAFGAVSVIAAVCVGAAVASLWRYLDPTLLALVALGVGVVAVFVLFAINALRSGGRLLRGREAADPETETMSGVLAVGWWLMTPVWLWILLAWKGPDVALAGRSPWAAGAAHGVWAGVAVGALWG